MDASYHLIRFQGGLDISRYPEFRKEFEELPPATPVLVDLTEARDADSVFLSEMLLARRRHAASFAVVIAPASYMARLFAQVGLSEKMNVYTSLSKAVESLGVIGEPNGLNAE